MIVNIICAVLGFYSLFKYTKGDYEVAMTDVVIGTEIRYSEGRSFHVRSQHEKSASCQQGYL